MRPIASQVCLNDLDYLEKLGLDLSHLGFESLRKFVVKELDIITPDYA